MSTLGKIGDRVKNCTRCRLHLTRKNAVPGDGNENTEIMFVGEAPGKNEDEVGRPFVGRAGQFLDFALAEAGLDRKDVFITNVVKCRPPGNRDPTDEEIESCSPYLDEQIEAIKPGVICTLGKFATGYILSSYGFEMEPISRIHGRIYAVPVAMMKIIPMYHPAATIYNPSLKGQFLEDMAVVAGAIK